MREIVRQSLAPLCVSSRDDRLTIDGPAVLIPARSAASWSMALHELGTNALKHGAFKTDKGQIKIKWRAAERGWLQFRWSEHGGPRVAAPKRRGFGSRLIESLARELEGNTKMEFDPSGLICTIDAPLHSTLVR